MTAQQRRTAYIGLGVAVLLWGTLHPVGKLALRELAPEQVALVRAVAAGLVLLGMCALTGRMAAVRAEVARPGPALALGLLGFAGSNGLSMLALSHLPAGSNTVLANTSPLFAAAVAPLLGERLSRMAGAGVLAGFVGVLLLGAGSAGGPLPPLWVAVTLAGSAAWAAYTLIGRRVGPSRDPLALTAVSALIGAVPLAVLAGPLSTLRSLAEAEPTAALAALWCGIGGMGVTHALWTGALRYLPAARVATTQYLVPPLALLVAGVLLGERPGLLALAGAALIVLGVAAAQRPGTRRAGSGTGRAR